MDLKQLHFSDPKFFWMLLVIPFVWMFYLLLFRTNNPKKQLEKFIDAHLLPFLLVNYSNKRFSKWPSLLMWTLVWFFLTIGLAGPRWNYREVETFSKDQSLVVLLDLSTSMDAADIKPSRLIRAKQKIEDLLRNSKGVKIGLIAFAADPHMITPLTEDKETIRHLLPSLDTELVYMQGSRLSPALEMAGQMLEKEPGNNKALLIVSDGGFEDSSAIVSAKKFAEKGVVIHTMGLGTIEGAPIKNSDGNVIKKNGTPVLSKLDKNRLIEISKVGKGSYLEPHFGDQDINLVLDGLNKRALAGAALGKKYQFWDEQFYWFVLGVLPVILWWFKRGEIFICLIVLCLPVLDLRAENDFLDHFKNSEQYGQQAFNQGDYEKAGEAFQDPYRKGVALYKAGQFKEAEELFRESSRPEVASDAAYNLGNSLVQQQKLKEAVDVYEELLKQDPGYAKAKDNLEIVKKILEKQEKEEQNSQDQNEQDKDKNQEDQKDSSSGKNDKENSDKQDSQENQEEQSQNEESQDESKESESEKNEREKSLEEEQKEEEARNSQNDERVEEETKEMESKGEEDEQSSEDDYETEMWLNRVTNDPKTFMKNKFYIESKKNGTTEGTDPW